MRTAASSSWTKIIVSISLFAGLSVLVPAWSQTHSESVRGTYIGNEGFLIEGGGRKVLVDSLYQGLRGYVAPASEERRAREEGRPPFEDIDLLLATHDHGDHFHPASVGNYLLAKLNTWFVSSPRAVERMEQEFLEFDEVRDRVRGAYPEEGERSGLRVSGVELEILNLHHGRGRNPPVQNLGFLFQLAGTKILHVGDTEATAEEFRAYNLAAENIDIAFIPFWHLLDEAGRQMIAAEISPRWIVPMHLPAADAPPSYFGTPGSLRALMELLGEIPNAVVFQNVMETHEFDLVRPPNPERSQ